MKKLSFLKIRLRHQLCRKNVCWKFICHQGHPLASSILKFAIHEGLLSWAMEWASVSNLFMTVGWVETCLKLNLLALVCVSGWYSVLCLYREIPGFLALISFLWRIDLWWILASLVPI